MPMPAYTLRVGCTSIIVRKAIIASTCESAMRFQVFPHLKTIGSLPTLCVVCGAHSKGKEEVYVITFSFVYLTVHIFCHIQYLSRYQTSNIITPRQ